MRSTDPEDLRREAQNARESQERQEVRRREMEAEAEPKVLKFQPRRKAWTRAFEMLGIQMMAIIYTAAGMLIGAIAAAIYFTW